ncbi:hypothetical protein QE414_002153 [Microbacterium sp. SORGH_AS 344]|nr:hypothetical protein [Microbacterium sp. SORGH_AS_0344]
MRVRVGRLEALGPHDLQLSNWNTAGLAKLIDVLRGIRGPLVVDSYLR